MSVLSLRLWVSGHMFQRMEDYRVGGERGGRGKQEKSSETCSYLQTPFKALCVCSKIHLPIFNLPPSLKGSSGTQNLTPNLTTRNRTPKELHWGIQPRITCHPNAASSSTGSATISPAALRGKIVPSSRTACIPLSPPSHVLHAGTL